MWMQNKKAVSSHDFKTQPTRTSCYAEENFRYRKEIDQLSFYTTEYCVPLQHDNKIIYKNK